MKIKCFHFCKKEFYDELITKQKIIANNKILKDNTFSSPSDYVKNYFFNIRKINGGNGMFFCWSHPNYKGDIEFDDNGEYLLLELEVNSNICLKTNYENWCSFAMDLYDADGNLNLADKYCKEMGIKGGIKGSYNAIFDTSNNKDEVQILIPFISTSFIRSVKRCKNKYI